MISVLWLHNTIQNDFVKDALLLVWYHDEVFAITFALVTAQMYIIDKVKEKAKKRICEILSISLCLNEKSVF